MVARCLGRAAIRPQDYGRMAGSSKERPAAPASPERQVTAAADIGPRKRNGCTQS
jgi:hypothetical protein